MNALLKSNLVCLLLIVGLYPASAQPVKCPIFMHEPRCGGHELGLSVLSWMNLETIHSEQGPFLGYSGGLFYKLHCRQNVLRVSLDLHRSEYERGVKYIDSPPSYGGFYAAGDRSIVVARLGYERRFGKGKLQSYVSVDIGYRQQVEEGVYEGWSDFVYNPYAGTERTVTGTVFLAGGIGLSYHPWKRLSFTFEGSYALGRNSFRRERMERSWIFPEERLVTWQRRYGTMRIDALRALAVSYHF